MPLKTFGPLVAEKFECLREDLADACEHLASEREAWLRDENDRLRTEVNELRHRIGLEPSKEFAVKERTTNGTSDESWQGENFVAIPAVSFVKPTFVPETPGHDTSGCQPLSAVNVPVEPESVPRLVSGPRFELLEELGSKTSNEEVLTELSEGSIERADVGFATRLARIATQVKTAQKAARRLWIDPASTGRLLWDIIGIPVLAWDLITIPLGVFAIQDDAPSLFLIADWITMCYWSIDIPLTFMTGIYDEDGNDVYDHQLIARNYFRGSFFLDVCLIGTDWIGIFVDLATGGNSPGVLKNAAILRIFRITRFARLVRLRKFKGKLQAIEDTFNNEWYLILVDLIVKILTILSINHYVGCGWYLLGDSNSLASPAYRWLTSLPYPTHTDGDGTLLDAPFAYKYTTCLHWALAQFTPGPHPIQPQNAWERVYAIGVLLFGMVVFSSFVAAVTQARLQMTKRMGKFERDHWLLREFCRQNKISMPLQLRMRRYVDFVVIPAQSKLHIEEVSFVKKLSPHLCQQLNNELYSRKLNVHPFFAYVRDHNFSVMNHICTQAIECMPLARGDVAFVGGQKSLFMLVVVSGCCEYIPIRDHHVEDHLEKGQWASEATFWTHWIHQGQLQASTETHTMCVDGATFRRVVLRSAVCMRLVRRYGAAFCESLNEFAPRRKTLTDLHDFASTYFLNYLPSKETLATSL